MVQRSSSTRLRQLAPGEFIGVADSRFPSKCGVVTFISEQKRVERHEHSDTHFVLVVAGSYRTSAEGADGMICSGHLLLNTPGTRHDDQFVGRGKLITLSLSDAALEQFAMGQRFAHPARLIRGTDSTSALKIIASEARDPDEASDLEIEGAAYELLATVKVQSGPWTHKPRWLERARAQVTEGLQASISINNLARDAGVHPVHLTRSFRTFFGQTPGAMVRRVSMKKAAHLLARTRAPICEIALECGFADQPAFSKAFKRATSISPHAFRRRWRN